MAMESSPPPLPTVRAAKVDRAQVQRTASQLQSSDPDQQQHAAAWFRGVLLAVGETVILLHRPPPLVGVSIGVWRPSVSKMTVSAMARCCGSRTS